MKEQNEGRLFAVIQVMGKQYKVTAGDILVFEGYWAPTIGDKIRMEKVCQTNDLLNFPTDFELTTVFLRYRFYLWAVTISQWLADL